MMYVERLAIPEVILFRPARHRDDRGFFSEVYSKDRFAAAGVNLDFVQDNQSLSRQAGVIRGLHFQTPPHAQGKLVRVTHGRILDVAVDIRRNSPSFGQYVAAELSGENWNQLWIPPGFAHGFCTLEPDTEVLYKVTAPYAPACDNGVAWDDPDIAIKWPVHMADVVLSEKDKRQQKLRDLPAYF